MCEVCSPRLPHGVKVHMTSVVEGRTRLVGGPGALEECRLLGLVRRPARPRLPHPHRRRHRSGLDGIEVLWLCRRCRQCCRRSGRSDCRRVDHRRTACWGSSCWAGRTLQGCWQLALWCGGSRSGGVCGGGVASGPLLGGGLLLFEERGQRFLLHIVRGACKGGASAKRGTRASAQATKNAGHLES